MGDTRRAIHHRVAAALVAVAALATTACLPGGELVLDAGVDLPDGPVRYSAEVFPGTTRTADVVYGRNTTSGGVDQDLLLDLYAPTGDTATGRPALIWLHGGYFTSGSRRDAAIVAWSQTFARKGYVTAAVSYRLHPTGCRPGAPMPGCEEAILDAKHDAQASVRWLRANAATLGIDPDRIAIAGYSAGAITALNVGNDPGDPGDSGTPGPSSAVRAAVSVAGGSAFAADPGDASVLAFHGTADTTVPYSWAEESVAASLAAGQVAHLIAWEGVGHGLTTATRQTVVDESTVFLFVLLDLFPTAPSG